MRPFILSPLFASVQGIEHVGPKTSERFQKLKVERVWDLVQLLPTRIEERHFLDTLGGAPLKEKVTCVLQIASHHAPKRPHLPYKVIGLLNNHPLSLVFFHARSPYLLQQLPVGSTKLVSGTLEKNLDDLQIIHPDYIGDPNQKKTWEGAQPLYGLTGGISQTQYRKIIGHALSKVPSLPEWIPESFMEKKGWAHWKESLFAVHHPKKETDLLSTDKARCRLAFDELFSHQLSLQRLRRQVQKKEGQSFKASSIFVPQVKKNLGFSLTTGQEEILSLLEAELCSTKTMMRLLQGDVGSGKTVVALLTMLQVIEGGAQTAILAPTEILATQHAKTLSKFLEGTNVRWALLTGKTSLKEKADIKTKLKEGDLDLLIGTHALLEGDVVFKNLGYVVIDEQHRFGVNQRKQLIQKGSGVNLLVMSATPIPRSLALTVFGDLDICQLKEKPKGREDIKTTVLSLDKVQTLYSNLKRAIDDGQKFYWVCPLIEESEALDLGHAEARASILRDLLGDKNVGLLHGRMKVEEKERVMQDFAEGVYKVLVSTTVIEVGVDVPDATVMIIEHAERFGLAQLHQLRGRVGRGSKPSSCVLLYGKQVSAIGKKRLHMMRETNDGFLIAEADLSLRGPGDVLGTKQSGLPQFKFADLETQGALLVDAHQMAKEISVQSLESEAFENLLALFPYIHQEHMKS